MVLAETLKAYIKESIRRKGQGGNTGLKGTVDKLVAHYFSSITKAVPVVRPNSLKEYIKQQVTEALILASDKEAQVQTKQAQQVTAKVKASGTLTVAGIQPPTAYIDGRLVAFSYTSLVEVGKTYTYYVVNDVVMVQGTFEGKIDKAMRYTPSATYEGFACHPRDFDTPGTKPDGSDLTNTYMYPLIDDDHGTKLLTYNGTDFDRDSDPSENYGNIDWLGKNGEVVSWRGPLGRQLAMNPKNNITGLTVFDYESESDYLPRYTPYQNFVYQEGEVLFEFLYGTKVLGASQSVVIISVDYDGRENPAGGTGGFYLEVWRGLSERIAYKADSRPTVPWFFNSTGLEAVSLNQKLVLTPDLTSAVFSDLNSGSGRRLNNYDSTRATWGYSTSGSWTMYRDYVQEELRSITLSVSECETSTHSGGMEKTFGDLPLMYSGEGPTVLTVSGDDAAHVGSCYTATLNGDHCPVKIVTWSFSGGTISDTGCITDVTDCGAGVVTASLSGPGFSLSGSKDVRLPSGGWVLINTESADPIYTEACGWIPCNCGCGWVWGLICPQNDVVYISGSMKYVGVHYSPNGTDCLPWPYGGGTVSSIKTYQWQCP